MSGSVPSSVQSGSSISKVDRRRRDNINDKIQQLLTKIPQELFQDYNRSNNDSESSLVDTPGSTTPKTNSAAKTKSTGTKDGKPNKGQILTQTVEYINVLQNKIDAKNREEVELIFRAQELSKRTGTIVNDVNLENTSAEVALAKIGVGPLAGDTNNNKSLNPAQEMQSGPVPTPGSASGPISTTSTAPTPVPASFPIPSRNSEPTSGFEYGGYTEYS